MTTKEQILSILSENKDRLRTAFKVRALALFGSYARGGQRKDSDVDILVDVDPSIGLDFVTLCETIDAVVCNLEIIGEAARQLPAAFRDAHREIEWHKVVGLRNRIVHEYFGVDLEIVWQILHHDLPRLHSSIDDIRP